MSATAISVSGFDYASLDKEVAAKLQSHAHHLRKAMERFGEVGQKIGEIIWNAHEELAGKGRDGKFKSWVESEGVEYKHAYNLMHVWERSKKYEIISHFPPTVAYLISAPEVPDAAIKDFEKQVGKGLKPTVAAVKETIDRHKEPARTAPERPQPPSAPPTRGSSAAPAPPTQSAAPDSRATLDEDGTPLNAHVAGFVEEAEKPAKLDLAKKQEPYDAYLNHITQAKKLWNQIVSDERDGAYAVEKRQRVLTALESAFNPVAQARPHAVCDHCKGTGCKKCSSCGWWPRSVVEGHKK